MTISYLNAYNRALIKIGSPPLDAGDVTSDLYLLLEEMYPSAITQVVSDWDWGSLSKRAIVEQDATAPIFGFDYRYTLPYDCLRVLEMYPSGYTYKIEGRYLLCNLDDTYLDPGIGVRYSKSLIAPWDPDDWLTDTDYYRNDFVTNDDGITTHVCVFDHTSDVFATDLSGGYWVESTKCYLDDISPLLLEAIICKLAYLLTYKVVQSQSLREGFLKEYEWILLRAKQVDAAQGTIEGDEEGSTEWVDSGRS